MLEQGLQLLITTQDRELGTLLRAPYSRNGALRILKECLTAAISTQSRSTVRDRLEIKERGFCLESMMWSKSTWLPLPMTVQTTTVRDKRRKQDGLVALDQKTDLEAALETSEENISKYHYNLADVKLQELENLGR